MPGGIMSKTPALLNYPAFAVTETLWLRDPGGLKFYIVKGLLKKKKKKNVWGAWLAQSEERATLDLRVHPAEWWLSPIPRLPGSCFSFSIAAIPSLGRWPVNLGSAACGSQGLESGPVDASSPFPAIALKGVYLVTCYLGVSKHRTEFREYNADFYTPVV
eukprot:XP_022260389.1 uncharacterized protein LOC102152163 isoform X2 [Canis lupus familiaris]